MDSRIRGAALVVLVATVGVAAPVAVRAQDDRGRDDMTSAADPGTGGDAAVAAAPDETVILPIRYVCADGAPQLAHQLEATYRFIPEGSGLADWVQLNTGETVGGELLRMRDGTLEFDSDEFGVITFDWVDLRLMRVSTPHTYVREDLVPIRGQAALAGGELLVCTAEGEVRLPAVEVYGIIEGSGREIERWSLSVSAGYSGNFGTARQDTLNGTVRIRREDHLSRLTLGYDVNWGRAEQDVADEMGAVTRELRRTINNMWGSAGLDIFVSREFYITAVQGRVGYDEFQNLRLRATPGAGVGYRIFDGGPDWDVELGGAYQYTEFRSVQVGDDQTRSDAGIRAATFVEVDLTDDLTVTASHAATLLFTDFGQSNFLTKAAIDYDLTDDIFVQATLFWDRLRDPTADENGVTPSQDTITVTAGLGVSL